jgi:hypothetical protein
MAQRRHLYATEDATVYAANCNVLQQTATYCNTHAPEDATVYATQFTHAPKSVYKQCCVTTEAVDARNMYGDTEPLTGGCAQNPVTRAARVSRR